MVLTMIFTLVPMNIFAEDAEAPVFSDMNESDYYAEAATTLAQLGILAGYPDGTFGAGKSITRAEMAAVVCRMINMEADAANAKGETAFDDVAGAHWASGYINIASQNSIINGDGNGKFRPEDNVLYEEAIKMVVCALGYGNDVVVEPDDWSKGYLKVAADNNISDNLKGTKGSASTRGDVAVMSYNGLASQGKITKAPATPVASKQAGEYTGTQKVTLSTSTEGAVIYYTTNGKVPTEKSTKYTKEISIAKTLTLKAIAVKDGVASDVLSVDYTIKAAPSGGGGGGGGATAKKYTVSFDLNYEGATGAPASQSVKKGGKAIEPEDPERVDYAFDGWYKDAECTVPFDFNTKIIADMTLYAKWVSGYVVSFDLNYEGATDAPENQNIPVGGKAVLPEEPSRDGYTFTGWATTAEGGTMWNFAHFVTESMTLYAIWATGSDISLDTPDEDVEIYSFNTDVYDILVGTSDEVTFTAEIFANIELEDTDVSVVDEAGSVLGYMNDDGINGDEAAEDGIYTLKITFNAEEVKNTKYSALVSDVESEDINIGFYREYTEEDFDEAAYVVDKLRDASQPFLNGDYTVDVEKLEDLMAALSLCLEEEKNNGTVEEYNVNFNTVKIVLADGYLFNYSVEVAGVSAGGSQVYVASYAPFDSIRRNPSEEALYDSALDGTAENIDGTFDEYVFSGDYNLNDVTLESLKSMSDYKVIIWGGHGGYDDSINGYGSSLMTGQLVDPYTSIVYSDDISAERILDNFMASGRNTYCVTGGFFEKYLGNMDGALVYLSACHSGQDMIDGISHKYQLAQAFINKGAKAVVGNSESIVSVYTYEMERDILNRLCDESDGEYYTLSEALEYAKSLNGSDDGSYRRAKPVIFPRNDQSALNYRLLEIAKGSISGKVMSAENSDNISNAVVRIYQNNDLVKSVRTDSNGDYTVELPEGDYIVKITAGNYKSAKMAVTVVADSTTYNETFLLVQVGDELGYANGTISNALNAQPVAGVTIKVRSNWNNQAGSVVYTTTTNEAGYYDIEYTPGLYTIEFSKEGFITGYKNIVVGILGLSAQNAIISPVMSDIEGEYRFVLSWRERPNDLDSHLTGPLPDTEERFHLYYPLKDSGGNYNPYREYASLDWDNTRINQSSDPETVTLYKQLEGGVYRYSVHDYTNGGYAESTDMANSNAKVDVYRGSILIGTYHVPNLPGTIWTVFELTGDTFTPINRVGNGSAGDISLYSLYEDVSEESESLYDEDVINWETVNKD